MDRPGPALQVRLFIDESIKIEFLDDFQLHQEHGQLLDADVNRPPTDPIRFVRLHGGRVPGGDHGESWNADVNGQRDTEHRCCRLVDYRLIMQNK